MHGGEWPYPCLPACPHSTRERQNWYSHGPKGLKQFLVS